MNAAAPAPSVGSRVVVRHRLDHPDAATGATLTDAVGTLVSRDEAWWVVRTRAGTERIAAASVVAAKVVPPRPSRRGAPHLALSVEDLQRVMVGAWGALEREPLGDWQLRASGGFTARGNSVMTSGSPAMPLEEAVGRAARWYAARGLPLDVTVAGPVEFVVVDDPLGALLLARGAREATRSVTMTASARDVASRRPGPGSSGASSGSSGAAPATVRLREELTDAWLTAYRRYRTGPEEAMRGVLTGSERQWFAEVVADGAVVGLGRLAVNDGWGGIAAMWVAPDRRRSGLGRAMLAVMAGRAVDEGAASLHLQVLRQNTVAQKAYTAAGFVPHHEYVNLVLQP